MNYSNIYNIKDFAINDLAPKYFNKDVTNDLNIGLFGYSTDLIANTTEDSFNVVSTLMNEMFPNLATLPESIYNYASLFQISDVFATSSKINILLLISEADILQYATKTSSSTTDNNLYEFFIDSSTIINIEGLEYLPDYDIRITYQKSRGDYIFNAMYNMKKYNGVYTNSMSDITNPYIKHKRAFINSERYLALQIHCHQCTKYIMNDSILSDNVTSMPSFDISFDGQLSNFEVFYLAPGDGNKYTQLTKLLDGSAPIKSPFCYYKWKDENSIQILFSTRDNYFQPEYASSIIIEYYTSVGADGNFEEYTGNNIPVKPISDVYDYNNSLNIFAIPQSGSYNGSDKMGFDSLKAKVVEMFSTVNSYTNENDLNLYFSNVNVDSNSIINFIKKRDDMFERLFTAFAMYKTSTDDIIHTNTIDIEMDTAMFDLELGSSESYILKPGHILTYKTNSIDRVVLRDTMITDALPTNEKFIYTNPFLIYFKRVPITIGYYLNQINSTHILDYSYVNSSSVAQFICNNVSVSRDALMGENKYKITLNIIPTSNIDVPVVNKPEGANAYVETGALVVRIVPIDGSTELGFYEFSFVKYDETNGIYTYSCEIETDDYINLNNKMRVKNMFSIESTPDEYNLDDKLIPMYNTTMEIRTYFNYNVLSEYNKENGISDISEYVLTNKYTTESSPISFIEPIDMIRSRGTYTYNGDGTLDENGQVEGGTYTTVIKSSPIISATALKTSSIKSEFFNKVLNQYNNMVDILEQKTNNYGIDMKFYNTYGKSKNFYKGNDSYTLIDRVNIKIHFQVGTNLGSDPDTVTRDIKNYIKTFIETINENGSNSFYVSNLIKGLENNIPDIKFLKFISINEYDSDVQAIDNRTSDLSTLTKDERLNYVPEYLTIGLDDIIIDIV